MVSDVVNTLADVQKDLDTMNKFIKYIEKVNECGLKTGNCLTVVGQQHNTIVRTIKLNLTQAHENINEQIKNIPTFEHLKKQFKI